MVEAVKRPAFQFYPGDWLRDTALRSCSAEARGIWVDMMCLAHDGEPYGHLRIRGKVLTETDIARMIGLGDRIKSACARMRELEGAGVFSRDPDGAIYSRRMVRDEKVREARAAGGVKSVEHPNTLKPKHHSEGYPSRVPSKGTHQGSPEGWNGGPPPASASAFASKDSRNSSRISETSRLLDGERPTAAAPPVAGTALVRREGRTHDAVLGHLKEMLAPERRDALEALKAEAKRRVLAELVFAYWQLKRHHQQALYDDQREGILVRSLKANNDNVSQLLYVVDGAGRDPWPDRKSHDGIEVLFRNRAQVERFASFCPTYLAGQPHGTALRYGLGETQRAPT